MFLSRRLIAIGAECWTLGMYCD